MYVIIQKYELIKNWDVLDESLEETNQSNQYLENEVEEIQAKVDKNEDMIVNKQDDVKRLSLKDLDETPEFALQEVVSRTDKIHRANALQELSFRIDGIYGSNLWIAGQKEPLGDIVIDFLKGVMKKTQRLMHQKKRQEDFRFGTVGDGGDLYNHQPLDYVESLGQLKSAVQRFGKPPLREKEKG